MDIYNSQFDDNFEICLCKCIIFIKNDQFHKLSFTIDKLHLWKLSRLDILLIENWRTQISPLFDLHCMPDAWEVKSGTLRHLLYHSNGHCRQIQP